MNALRFAATLCATLCVISVVRAQQFTERPDPNLPREAARAIRVPPVPRGVERNGLSGQAPVVGGEPVPRQYTGGPDDLLGSLAATRDTDPNLYNAYREYLLAYLTSERQKIDDHREVIASTNRMGTWVFVVVHIFLGLAMVVALVEFWQASRTRHVKREQEEIELSFQKIALKTSMHGTLLLVLSLVLYFLFLKFVYTIVPV